MNLNGRGLRTKQHAVIIGEIEGVLPVAGGMPFACVELIEVIYRVFYLRTFNNGEAHADADFLYLVKNGGERMLFADDDRCSGDGDVYCFTL